MKKKTCFKPPFLKKTYFTPFWPNFEIQALFGILGHFRLSERYMYLKTTILNQSCDHFEGSTRLCTTIFYKIMNLTQFWKFGPFFAFWAIFRSPVSLKFISQYGFLHKIYWIYGPSVIKIYFDQFQL